MNILMMGYGRMGRALKASWSSIDEIKIFSYDPYCTDYGDSLHITDLSNSPVEHFDIVVFAVKPTAFETAAESLPTEIVDDNTIFTSIMAGVTTERLTMNLPAGSQIVRVMPNSAVLVQCGSTALFSRSISNHGHATISRLFGETGRHFWLNEESEMDVFTAISGSGIAYFHYFSKLLSEFAENNGLSKDLSKEIIIATINGAARLQDISDDEFEVLITNVRSPEGTTDAALSFFESDSALKHMVDKACATAVKRSIELNGG